MKICSKCGAQAEDQVNFCAACGSSEFYASAQNSEQPTTQYYNAAEQNPAYQQPVEQPFTPPAINENSNGSILSGVVGAFLFSIIVLRSFSIRYLTEKILSVISSLL